MTAQELSAAVAAAKARTRAALQTVYDALNNGQRKKLAGNAEVKALFDLYGVEYDWEETE